MNHIHNHEAAPAASSAGSTGSEARKGAPEILERALRDFYKDRDDNMAMAVFGLNERLLHSLRDQGAEALAIVSDGHIHLGVIHRKALSHVLSSFHQTDELCVHYEYGGVLVYTSLFGPSRILITADDSRTIWGLKDGIPCAVTQASLYALIDGQLIKYGTKPARSSGTEEEVAVD